MKRVGRAGSRGDMEDQRLYSRDRKIILHDRWRCEIGDTLEAVIDGHTCRGRATSIHHRRPRQNGGSLRAPSNLVAVCSDCHPGPVHDNTSDARRWLVARGPNAGKPILVGEADPEWEALGKRANRLGGTDG